MTTHPTPHINALYDAARYDIKSDGGVSTSTGLRLLAEGIDPDALEVVLRDELDAEQEENE